MTLKWSCTMPLQIYWFMQLKSEGSRWSENSARALMKNREGGICVALLRKMRERGGCERMWLRCGGVAENRVIMAMSAECWHCLERKRRRRASKRRGENERERLAELLRGDQRVTREKELFGLWRHDMLIIPLRISSIRGCKTKVAWLGAVCYGFVNNLTAEFSAIWICATVWLRRANRALERYVWSWELITRDS